MAAPRKHSAGFFRRLVPVFFPALAVILGPGSRAASAAPVVRDSVVYKVIDGKSFRLFTYAPSAPAPSGRLPAIVFFFGGGWKSGTPSQFRPQGEYFASRGILAFAAEYRVKSRDGTSPSAAVKDGKSAIRWVRKHADSLGVDPDLIFAAGGSAGGHVAASTGTLPYLEEPGEDLAVSSRPLAMALFNPVTNTTEDGYGYTDIGPDSAVILSPVHHVSARTPPAVLFHGTADTTVPFGNSEQFCRELAKRSIRCELQSFQGKGHGFFNNPPYLEQTTDSAYRFVRSILRQRTVAISAAPPPVGTRLSPGAPGFPPLLTGLADGRWHRLSEAQAGTIRILIGRTGGRAREE